MSHFSSSQNAQLGKLIALFTGVLFLSACKDRTATAISNSTFVYGSKVYKVVGNKLTQLGDLEEGKVTDFDSLKSSVFDLGEHSLSFVKDGATAKVEALYRGDILYLRMKLDGMNDLKDRYLPGQFSIELTDDKNFILKSVSVPTNELSGVVDASGKVNYFLYQGSVEMNSDVFAAVQTASIGSTVKPR